MNTFLSFFEALSNLQKISWVIICMTFFWLIEGAFPAVVLGYKKWRHAKVNLVLLGSTILINAIFWNYNCWRFCLGWFAFFRTFKLGNLAHVGRTYSGNNAT